MYLCNFPNIALSIVLDIPNKTYLLVLTYSTLMSKYADTLFTYIYKHICIHIPHVLFFPSAEQLSQLILLY